MLAFDAGGRYLTTTTPMYNLQWSGFKLLLSLSTTTIRYNEMATELRYYRPLHPNSSATICPEAIFYAA